MGALDFGFDAQSGDRALFFCDEVVYADYDLVLGFYRALVVVGGFLDFALDEAAFYCPQHSSHGVDFVDVRDGAGFDFISQVLDSVGPSDGIDGVGDAGFVGDDLLRAESDQRGVLGGEGEGFVHGIGVERLAAAENGGEGLDGYANDIVFGLLGGEGGAGGLRVESEEE